MAAVKPRKPIFDVEAFIEDGTIAVRQRKSTKVSEAIGKLPNITDGEQKVSSTYRHKKKNYICVQRLAALLNVSRGDLLDEAIERMLSQWTERIPKTH